MLLLNFDSSQYLTSYTGKVIHYSNYVSNFIYADFSDFDSFAVVGQIKGLNAVSFATERALMMMYSKV